MTLLGIFWQLGASSSDFNPHENRDVGTPTTYVETFVHLLKGSIGAGILAMPFAVGKMGLIFGIIGTVLIGLFGTYCLHLLIQSQYTLCKRHTVGYLKYPKSMQYAVEDGPKCFRWSSKYFPCFVDSFLIFWQLGLCCVYVVFVATNIKQVCDVYGVIYSIRLHMCFILTPLIILNIPKNLKIMAPISTVANVLTLIGLLLVFFYVFNLSRINMSPRLFGPVSEIPMFVGITLFALEAVGVVLSLEYHMEKPHRFIGICGLLSIGMFVILTLYVIVGISGYLKYGDTIAESVTLSLPQGEIPAQLTKVLFALAIMMSHPLQCFVAYDILWHHIRESIGVRWKKIVDYFLRVFLVLVTYAAAIAIPTLGPFISLFGAFCLSMLGIILPGIIDVCVRYPDSYGLFYWHIVKDIIIIMLGLFGMVSGSYVSIVDIYDQLVHGFI